MNKEVIECPICFENMVEEEGLFWCDACGINENSSDYFAALEKQWCDCPYQYPIHWKKECPFRS